MLRIVKERCAAAGLPESICNHTFRGTGITVFLQNGGSLEAAQDMANHSDPRTTKLYDRRKDLATLSEIERRIASNESSLPMSPASCKPKAITGHIWDHREVVFVCHTLGGLIVQRILLTNREYVFCFMEWGSRLF
jgi:hypothetical protein